MIKLTYWATDKPLIINPEKIARIDGDEKGSNLYESLWDDTSLARVTESPEEVTRKILEYKLAMARYSMTYAISVGRGDKMSPDFESTETEWELRNLAGLEEIGHDQ